MSLFEHATFGNRDGSHQLLETSLVGEEFLLEDLRFLVDRPVGHIGPEVVWSPYWGCGPLRDWWVLWRGDEDTGAPRKNMVKSRVVLVRQADVGFVPDMEEFFRYLSVAPTNNQGLPIGRLIKALSGGLQPVIVPNLAAAPALLGALWPRLWPSVRGCLTLRTFFGSESLEFGGNPHIVIVPSELGPRWRAHTLVDSNSQEASTDETSWFSDPGASGLGRLLRVNWDRLPGDFSVLTRLERITHTLESLEEHRGEFADALLIVRTVESFEKGLELPEKDIDLLVSHLSAMKSAKMTDIRTASLVKLSIFAESLPDLEMAVSKWIQERLPAELDVDALWILEAQTGSSRASWWLRALRTGLSKAFADLNSDWAKAIWRWWTLNPRAMDWSQGLLNTDSETEASLLLSLPNDMGNDLHVRIRALCVEHQWAKLLAGSLRNSEPLNKGLKVLRKMIADPESGLDVLLAQRRPSEIVASATESRWKPLRERAALLTIRDTALLDHVDPEAPGYLPLLADHLSAGGEPPSTALSHSFNCRLFDGCIDGDNDCAEILFHLGARAAGVALVYDRQDQLWNKLGVERREPLLSATGLAWLKALIDGKRPERPGTVLSEVVRIGASTALRGGSIGPVIDYLMTFPEVTEREVVNWLVSEGFSWRRHDEERIGQLLIDRNWAFAAKRFARSPKAELKAAAWHARGLIMPWGRPSTNPFGIESGPSMTIHDLDKGRSEKMKILFLAANPTSSDWLAIDQEARSIEEKLRGSKFRDGIEFHSKWAVRPDDLHQALLEEQPTIVHFSGHGAGTRGILLHSETEDNGRLVSAGALAHLFSVLKDNVRVVVLNACYSEEQAERIVEEIDFVVGMADSIRDDAARLFAAAFYRGLGFGRTVQTSYELGISELKLMGFKDDANIPVLRTRDGVDAGSVTLARPASA